MTRFRAGQAAEVRVSLRLVGGMRAEQVEAQLRVWLEAQLETVAPALEVLLTPLWVSDPVYSTASTSPASMSCAATAMSAAVPGEGAPLTTWEASSIPAAGVLAAHFKLPVAILPAYPARGWMEVQEQRSVAEYQAAVRFNSIYLFNLAAAQ